jgi:fatty acid desaturase
MSEALAPEYTAGQRPITPLQLRELSAKRDAPAFIRVLLQYTLIAANAAAIWQAKTLFGWAWALPLVALQGFLISFQFMLVHETAHRTAFRTRWPNLFFGHISGAAIILPYEYYTEFHWDHHRYTQDPAQDPELVFRTPPSSLPLLIFAFSGVTQVLKRLQLMLRHALTGRVTVPWVPAAKHGLIVREARLYILAYLVLAALSVAFGSSLLLWVWVGPILVGQLMLRPYLLSEHTGCGHTRSAFENTRTTYTNALMRWFTWNMPYHVEHHAYPSVPFHALPALNRLVDGRIQHRGNGYLRVVRLVWNHMRGRMGQTA